MTAPAVDRPAAGTVPPAAETAWWRVLLAAGARTVLASVLAMALWAAVPALLGWHSTTVMTGSMMPRLAVGDLAVSRPAQPAKLMVNQVILFPDPDHAGRLRLHRFVGVDDAGLIITRGDANPQVDSSHVAPAAVVGIATLRVPYLGLPIVWLRAGQLVPVAATAATLVALLALSGLDPVGPFSRRRDEPGPPDPPAGPSDPGDSVGSDAADEPVRTGHAVARAALRRLAVGGVAATVGLAALVGAGHRADAGFVTTASNKTSSWAAAPYFTCAAAVAADGPGLFYRLNETSGNNVADSSASNAPATYRGTVTFGATRPCSRDTGTAVTLDGSTAFIGLNTQVSLAGTYSFELWFKTRSTRGGWLVGLGNAASGASTTTDRVVYLTSAGKVVYGFNPASPKTVTSASSYNDNAWHHLMVTQSSAGMRLYVDGGLVGSSTATTSGSFTGYFRVGYDSLSAWPSTPSSLFLSGSVDEVAAYTKALTATDAAEHYDAAS